MISRVNGQNLISGARDVVNVTTCNLLRVSFENAEEAVNDLLKVQRGVLCVQEVRSWPAGKTKEFNLVGWTAQRSADSPSAVLIPFELEGAIPRMGSHFMHALVLLDRILHYIVILARQLERCVFV